jgi:GxxExxY protein
LKYVLDEIIVEIKTAKELADERRAQAIHDLQVIGEELGLLVNFEHYPKLKYEQFIDQSIS